MMLTVARPRFKPELHVHESQGACLPKFDDRGWRQVRVPGEIQLQTGLEGMDLYYPSKQLTLINEKE